MGANVTLAFPFGEGGLTRLSAAVKTEEVVFGNASSLSRLCFANPPFPKGRAIVKNADAAKAFPRGEAPNGCRVLLCKTSRGPRA